MSDEIGLEKEIDSRKSWRKILTLKTGQRVDVRDVHRCRKIFYKCEYGTLEFKIGGGSSLEGRINPGYEGGPLGPGGGAYQWGNIDFLLVALSDAKIYVHIEWETGVPTFPFASD